jgi:hypothetical protein
MTLCGVLKNILLVIASVIIWGSVITGLQFIGYGIATAGLIYYGVGYEGIQTYYAFAQVYANKIWEGESDTSTAPQSPLLRKALIISVFVVIAILLIVGVTLKTQHGTEFVQTLSERITGVM